MAVSSAMWAIMLILSIWMNLIDWLWRRGGRSSSSAVSMRLVLSSLQNDERWRDLWNFHYTCVREAISCETWRQIVQEITQITRVLSSSLHFPGPSIKGVAPQQRHLAGVCMFSPIFSSYPRFFSPLNLMNKLLMEVRKKHWWTIIESINVRAWGEGERMACTFQNFHSKIIQVPLKWCYSFRIEKNVDVLVVWCTFSHSSA